MIPRQLECMGRAVSAERKRRGHPGDADLISSVFLPRMRDDADAESRAEVMIGEPFGGQQDDGLVEDAVSAGRFALDPERNERLAYRGFVIRGCQGPAERQPKKEAGFKQVQLL